MLNQPCGLVLRSRMPRPERTPRHATTDTAEPAAARPSPHRCGAARAQDLAGRLLPAAAPANPLKRVGEFWLAWITALKRGGGACRRSPDLFQQVPGRTLARSGGGSGGWHAGSTQGPSGLGPLAR